MRGCRAFKFGFVGELSFETQTDFDVLFFPCRKKSTKRTPLKEGTHGSFLKKPSSLSARLFAKRKGFMRCQVRALRHGLGVGRVPTPRVPSAAELARGYRWSYSAFSIVRGGRFWCFSFLLRDQADNQGARRSADTLAPRQKIKVTAHWLDPPYGGSSAHTKGSEIPKRETVGFSLGWRLFGPFSRQGEKGQKNSG